MTGILPLHLLKIQGYWRSLASPGEMAVSQGWDQGCSFPKALQELLRGRGGAHLGRCQALIHHLPESDHRLPLCVEEILKESAGIKRGGIGVAFAVLADFYDPILRFE